MVNDILEFGNLKATFTLTMVLYLKILKYLTVEIPAGINTTPIK